MSTPSNAIDVSTSGIVTFNGTAFSGGNASTSNITGITSGSAPSAGFIGQQIRAFTPVASKVTITNNGTSDIASITLTAGIWDICYVCQFEATGVSTQWVSAVSTTSATLPASSNAGDFYINNVKAGGFGSEEFNSIGGYRVTISGSTTYYLVAFATFSTGAASGYGRISGTRVG